MLSLRQEDDKTQLPNAFFTNPGLQMHPDALVVGMHPNMFKFEQVGWQLLLPVVVKTSFAPVHTSGMTSIEFVKINLLELQYNEMMTILDV